MSESTWNGAKAERQTTIAAVASAPGASCRAIVRLSGPLTVAIVRQVWTPNTEWPIELRDEFRERSEESKAEGQGRRNEIPREGDRSEFHASRPWVLPGGMAWDAGDGRVRRVPCDLFLWTDDHSYTGEPCAEFHLPGAAVVVSAMMTRLCEVGAIPAGPGEFTLRAFLHGRLDLMRAEAVLGTIDAGDERSLRTALTQLSGSLSNGLTSLRESVADLVARLEAGFDFADEPISFTQDDEIAHTLERLTSELTRLLTVAQASCDADPPVRMVLVGRPNTGKSRLFNRLTGGNRIVSATAGTTRDYQTAFLCPLHRKKRETSRETSLMSIGRRSHRRHVADAISREFGTRHNKRGWRYATLTDTAGIFECSTPGIKDDEDTHKAKNTKNRKNSKIAQNRANTRVMETASECLEEAETPDAISIDMAWRQWRDAELVVLCLDATQPETHAADRARFLRNDSSETEDSGRMTLCVRTKCDLYQAHMRLRLQFVSGLNAVQRTQALFHSSPRGKSIETDSDFGNSDGGSGGETGDAISVSAVTGQGIRRLKRELVRRVKAIRTRRAGRGGDLIPATAVRCRESLRQALMAMERAKQLSDESLGDELVAVELRRVLHALGELTGAVYTDDLLERVFSRFCIGK